MAVFGPFLRFDGWKWRLKGVFFGVRVTFRVTFRVTWKNEMRSLGLHLG